jgi:hypothetical protein
MMNYKLYLFGIITLAAVATRPVQAATHEWGLGGRYHMDHSVFEELPFGDEDIGYGLAYEYHDVSAFWQIAVTYAPDVTGTNGIDSVTTPELNLIFDDSWLRLGLGILSSYVRQDVGGNDWTDLYWQFIVGLNFPISSLTLSINAYYPFEDWGNLEAFDAADIEYGAWLTLEL